MGIASTNIQLKKWVAVFCLGLLLVSLSLFSFWALKQISSDIEALRDVELPLFEDIHTLRTSMVALESAVYEYYLTTDYDKYLVRYQKQSSTVDKTLSHLLSQLGDVAELKRLSAVSAELTASSSSFAKVMAKPSIDWDRARVILAGFGPLIARANTETELLNNWVSNRVLSHSQASAERMRYLVALVLLLTTIAMIAAAWLFRANYSRLAAQREQERLASFPSGNPYPVLALDVNGGIIYANNAAYSVATSSDPTSILPDDLPDNLTQSKHYKEWEFEKGGRSFRINLGWLPEYQEYHAFVSDISARKEAEEYLEYLAYHEPTTGLINRQQFNHFVDRYLIEDDIPMIVAIMDIHLLDSVVATAGVSTSEKVARMAAMRLKHAIEDESLIEQSCLSHIGSGLFCFACPAIFNEGDSLYQLMQDSIARPFDIDGFEFYLKLSMGLVLGEHIRGKNSDEALRLADGALDLAKKRGGQVCVCYEEAIEKAHSFRMEVELGLRRAIEKNEFELFYQPKFSLETRLITGAEALIRWKHGDKGYVSPADFIPIAEDSGQILDIGQWTLERACEDVAKWNQVSLHPIDVAVNISAKQLLHTDLGAAVLAAVERNGIDLSSVQLEITETAALTDFERALEKLELLSHLGVILSLDDFGTGYSSLSYLQRLPVQSLKIDRSFVQRLEPGTRDESLAETIVSMAHQLDLAVVAEGVENYQQLTMLNSWGCEYVQGFLLAKPMPLHEFIAFIQSYKPVSDWDSAASVSAAGTKQMQRAVR